MAGDDISWPHSVSRGFSLLGGPLNRLGCRLALVRGANTARLGLTLGVGVWLVVLALAFTAGDARTLFTLAASGEHTRLLISIPLFFICESWIDPLMTAFVVSIVRNGIVPPTAIASLDAEVTRVHRLVNAWWPEAVCLTAAVALAITGSRLQSYGATGGYDAARTSADAVIYFHVGLTLFRFLLFRWVWKLALWSWFLWRVSRIELQLIPGHPDRAGGLGILEAVHERFTPLVAALSFLECASLAEAISTGTLAPAAVYPSIAVLLLIDGVLFLGPLLVFTDRLWAARTNGLGIYMDLAASYVTEFEAKWLGSARTAPVLGTPDLQSLADLANSVNVVQEMRWITAGPRLLIMIALAAIVPLAPLVLFQYPLAELSQRLLSRLVGL